MRQSSLIILIIVIIVIIVAVRENLICTKSHIWDFVRQNGVTFVIIVIIIIIIIYRKSKSINTLAPMEGFSERVNVKCDHYWFLMGEPNRKSCVIAHRLMLG